MTMTHVLQPKITLTLAVLGLLAASSLLAPAATAVEFPFGSAVGSSDYDLSPTASASSADLRYALCFIDDAADGAAGPEDYVVLVTKVAAAGVCPASIVANGKSAFLLNTNGADQAGTEIKMRHPIAGQPLTDIDAPGLHAVRYFEDGSSAEKMDARDTLYIDLVNVGATPPTVNVGDLRISPWGSLKGGAFVQDGDADLNNVLTNIRAATAPASKLMSTPSLVYKASSAYYVNSDFGPIQGTSTCAAVPCTLTVTGDVGVEAGDFRLNPKATNPLSDKPSIIVDGVSLSDSVVAPGEVFQLSIKVLNTGKGAGAGLVNTYLDGKLWDARGTPPIEPAQSVTLVVSLPAPLETGRLPVKAGDYTTFVDVVGTPAADGATSAQLDALAARVASLEAAGWSAATNPGPAVEAGVVANSAAGPVAGVDGVILALAGACALAVARRLKA